MLRTVTELDQHVGPQLGEAIIGKAMTLDEAGVLIKGTQGTRWVNPHLDELHNEAAAMGVLTGWLHYAEPWANSAEAEALAIAAALAARPLALGLWVELDELGGFPVFELVEWVSGLVSSLYTPNRPMALVCSSEVYGQLAGLPGQLRIVLTSQDELDLTRPWGRRHHEVKVCDDGTELTQYTLTSVRGIVEPQLVAVAPEDPQLSLLPPGDLDEPTEPLSEPTEPDEAELDEDDDEHDERAQDEPRDLGLPAGWGPR